MEDYRQRVSEVADLMEEFRLSEAEMAGEGWSIMFRRKLAAPPSAPTMPAAAPAEATALVEEVVEVEEAAPARPAGTPVSSPMNGIFYTSPSPSAPPFVKQGEMVSAGQVVGLIEAMKVFNEIVAPTAGTVLEVVAETGQVVQPGEPLMYIG